MAQNNKAGYKTKTPNALTRSIFKPGYITNIKLFVFLPNLSTFSYNNFGGM